MPRPNRAVPNQSINRKRNKATITADRARQKQPGTSQPELLNQFEGPSEDDNANIVGGRLVPPDTNGDVGPDNYVQFINVVWAVYDKTGTLTLGPLPGNSFFEGFGGPCESTNDGDPMVKYDRMADRWVFTQFAVPNRPAGPSYQCFAVSKTGDPGGEYWLYEFTIGSEVLGWGDYPKLGVWPDAYYIAYNMFAPSFNGMGSYAFDRSSMLNGGPAGEISFQTFDDGGGLPTDMDGANPPPDGAPNYFMTQWDNSTGQMNLYQFHVDWGTPLNSTFTGPVAIFGTPWNWALGAIVPQMGGEALDTLGDRLMNRLAYRNFGDHETLVTNFTVAGDGGNTAVRWMEVRDPGGTPVVYQDGTYDPDTKYRWMGSIAQDKDGNMALGYSTSSSTQFPDIRFTGRLAGDPLGTMGTEDLMYAGTGSQTDSFNRWGDYSSMQVDPTDDCTFWYTQEYYANTNGFDFKTRIGSFKFPTCKGVAGTLQGTVTGSGNSLQGVTISATPSPTGPRVPGFSTTTDAAGRYSRLLPPGTYDVTASKYGYVSGTALGVSVSDGGMANQDFDLSPSLTVPITGVVKDGSGQGWPLYAKVDILPGRGGFAGTTMYTDPVTGYYETTLVAGSTYQFVVTSVHPGYVPGGGSVLIRGPSAAPDAQVVNWNLNVNGTCTAPGYAPGSYGPPVFSEGFDAGALPAGWTIQTSGGPGWLIWSGADPCGQFGGNLTGGSGPYALLNSNNNTGDCGIPEANDDSSLVTRDVDLSDSPNAVLSWANDYHDLFSRAQVDASIDGGTTWVNIWDRTGVDERGPGTQTADMSFAAGSASARVRFHYQGFGSWWWQVDNVQIKPAVCTPLAGGLVLGNVTDGNTGLGLNGAVVANLPQPGGPTAMAASTPSQGDGYFTMFVGSGSQSFEASMTGYIPVTHGITVVPNASQRIDFSLPAGRLDASPRPLSAIVNPGGTVGKALMMSNSGSGPGTFDVFEVNASAPSQSNGPSANRMDRARAVKRVPAGRLNATSPRGFAAVPKAPQTAPEAPAGAGNVVNSFSSGLASGWGLAFNTDAHDLWITNPDDPSDGLNGDGLEYQYQPEGTQTGETVNITGSGGLWQADGTYNARTRTIWHVNVGDGVTTDSCLFEVDPATEMVTGRKICGPWTAISQRAVAYDYVTDTYYVGGWNETVIYHIDSSGNVRDSIFTGLNIGGMAYNPSTGHLFVYTFSNLFDIWVLDPHNGYATVNAFNVTQDGARVFPALAGADFDCDGHLWLFDQTPDVMKVYEVDSGETGGCVNQIPWLSETPTSGTIPGSVGRGPANSLPISMTFDSAGLLPGLRQGQLAIGTDTPYPMEPVPVNFTVRFLDVPDSNQFQAFIYGSAGAGVMPGGPPNCPQGVFDFCPDNVVTRADAAGYMWRAVMGTNTPPPVYQNIYGDVTFNQYNSFYIQGITNLGITVGCGNGNYCPNNPSTRAQMAIFIYRGEHGGTPPPACSTQYFDDVPCGSFGADYINAIYRERITAGCGGGKYCPDGKVTNAQMATFLVRAFHIPYVP